jgi:hypothetical protein
MDRADIKITVGVEAYEIGTGRKIDFDTEEEISFRHAVNVTHIATGKECYVNRVNNQKGNLEEAIENIKRQLDIKAI